MGVTKSAMKIHWRGTVGGIVGGRQYGQDTWRSLADTISNPNSVAQQIVRAKFKAVTQAVKMLGYAYRLGYKMFIADGKGPRALFSRQIHDNALQGDLQQGFTIDPTKVEISKGGLTPCHTIAAAVAPATQTVTVSWSDNTGVGDAEATDQLCYLLLNLTKETSIYGTDVATRAEESFSLTYPADWAGDTGYLYVFWNGKDKGCSSSKMLGVYSL